MKPVGKQIGLVMEMLLDPINVVRDALERVQPSGEDFRSS